MAEQNTTDKLTLAKFEEAYDIVHKVVLPTKLIYSDYFSGITVMYSLKIPIWYMRSEVQS